MDRDLDMNGYSLLNLGVDLNNPGSLLTVAAADIRYYNIAGDSLEGPLDANFNSITNLKAAETPLDAVRNQELLTESAIRQQTDEALQDQISGAAPLQASAFSPISWHDQTIVTSVNIPSNKNAWSFGPTMSIAAGQIVTVGANSFWTIANGDVQ
jgi:hypothetical protein